MSDFLFIFLGIFTGVLGTLIGAGGGFILSPIFIFMYPNISATQLTAMSLMVIAANSVSGTVGYAVRDQIHWKSVLFFSLAAIPGVHIGIELIHTLRRDVFDFLFGIMLVALAIFIFYRSQLSKRDLNASEFFWSVKSGVIGSVISFFVGILSSLMGIGGGIVHVPLLSEGLKYPLHIAAGTSHAILAITSVNAVANHFLSGDYTPLNPILPYLCLGLILGAQIGAYLSKRVSNKSILRILAGALFIVGIRLFFK